MIDIAYRGVCHSDIHQVRDEWGGSLYPMVPGHEIVGHVRKVGSDVTAIQPGQVVGVGCMLNSCRECTSCKRDLEQFCEQGMVPTYYDGCGRISRGLSAWLLTWAGAPVPVYTSREAWSSSAHEGALAGHRQSRQAQIRIDPGSAGTDQTTRRSV